MRLCTVEVTAIRARADHSTPRRRRPDIPARPSSARWLFWPAASVFDSAPLCKIFIFADLSPQGLISLSAARLPTVTVPATRIQ